MAGILDLDLKTAGKLSDIEAERYENLPTSGSLVVTHLDYSSTDLPQGIRIQEGRISFTPEKLNIEKYVGEIGHSPVTIAGYLDGYLAYALLPDQKIKGEMTLRSSKFDANEWMTESSHPTAPSTQTTGTGEGEPMEVYAVPGDIDFTFNCEIAKVLYDNMTLEDMRGQVLLRDREVSFRDLAFGTLGGSVKMNGSYDTKDASAPAIEFGLGVAQLDIQKAYETFVVVRAFAPVAKFIQGKFGTNLSLAGKLRSDMSPDLNSINIPDGTAVISEGRLKGFKALEMVADKIKISKIRELHLKDTKVFFKVANGRIEVEPFDVQIGTGKMTVQGSNGLDQSMAYDLAFDLPAGVAGQAAMNAVGGFIGKPLDAGSDFKVNVGLGGTVDNPKITYLRNSKGESAADILQDKVESVKNVVMDTVKNAVTNTVNQAKEKAKAEAAKIIADAEAAAARIRAEGQAAADRINAEANKKADEIENSAKNPVEKIAKKKAAQVVRKEGLDAANKALREANEKADKVMADARSKSDALLRK
jgi:hypothetical protein